MCRLSQIDFSNNPALTGLVDDIKIREGWSSKPYRCPAGRLTIGYGLNLEAGISKELGELILIFTTAKIYNALKQGLPFFTELTIARKQVLMDMAYQLGIKGLFSFTGMLSALYTADYDTAAEEMLDSKWHRDLIKYAKGKEQTTRSYKSSQVMRIGF